MNKAQMRRTGGILLLVGALVVAAAFIWGGTAKQETHKPGPVASDFGPQKAPDECVDKYNIVLDKNSGNRVLSTGLPKGTAQHKLDYVVAKAQHDPRVLQLAWNNTPAGAKHPVNDVNKLVDNGCYSQFGRDLFQQTKGIYEAASVVTDNAPAEGVNTGVQARGAAFQEPAGKITGDRSGIRVTFSGTHTSVWIMNRCSNFVTPHKIPGVQPKPKPTPKPKCTVRCHPTPKCVPPSNIPKGEAFNPTTCELYKPPQTKDCMLNGGLNCPPNGGNQPPQSNACCDTGPTKGAPSSAPSPNPTGPKPSPNSSAPPPNSGGYDSGSGNGSGTPQGSTCDSSGCQGGGPSNPSPGPTDSSNSGDHNSGASPQPSPPG